MDAFFKKVHPLFLAGAVSILATVLFFFYDAHSQRRIDQEAGQSLLTQLMAQADSLYYAAKARGEADPSETVARFFSVGKDPRSFLVRKIDPNTKPAVPPQPGEVFLTDFGNNKFEIRKKLDAEKNTGIVIEYTFKPVGFLGARSTLGGDFRAALFFFAVFLILGTSVQRWLERKEILRVYALQEQMQEWVRSARTTLNGLSTVIRETMESAQALDDSLQSPKQMLEELGHKIHSELTEIHSIRRQALEAEKASAYSLLNLLKLLKKAKTLGDPEILGFALTVENEFNNLRTLQSELQKSLKSVEITMEPWAMDADLSYQAYENSVRYSQELKGHLRETTKQLMNQAQSVRALDSMK